MQYHQERGLVGRWTDDLMSTGRTYVGNAARAAGKAARSVKTPVYAVLIAGGLGLTALGIYPNKANADHAGQVSCSGTYVVDVDNTGNGGVGGADGDMDSIVDNLMSNHPVEFKINVGQAGNYTLTIKVWGAEMSVPDLVKANGYGVGVLQGDDATWVDSVYSVGLNSGDNLIEVYIDNSNGIGMDAIEVGCAGATFSPSVGGIASLPRITGDSAYSIDHSNGGLGAREYAIAAGAAGALALGGAGAGLYYSRRRQNR